MKYINLKEKKKFDKRTLLINKNKLINPVSWKFNTALLLLFG